MENLKNSAQNGGSLAFARVAIFAALIGLFTVVLTPTDALAQGELEIRTIPDRLTTWEEIRQFVLKGVHEDIERTEKGTSLVLSTKRHWYQVLLYNGAVIQSSSLTSRENGYTGDVQFGRSAERNISTMIDQSDYLKWLQKTLQEKGVVVTERQSYLADKGIKSALVLPTTSNSPMRIDLSDKYPKHPIFGFAHEGQHVLNRPHLEALVQKHFPQIQNPTYKKALMQFIDEALAIENEMRVYKELIAANPHLANIELQRAMALSRERFFEWIFERWGKFYHWHRSVLELVQKSGFQPSQDQERVFELSKEEQRAGLRACLRAG